MKIQHSEHTQQQLTTIQAEKREQAKRERAHSLTSQEEGEAAPKNAPKKAMLWRLIDILTGRH